MSEQRSFERFVADNVAGDMKGIPLPDDFYDDLHSFATTARQRPEWLALIKEPPMRSNSQLVVGSPTVRVTAIVIVTLLLTATLIGAGFAGAQLFAADGPIVVDQSGNGTTTTIAEAVAKAEDGDEILIRPGTYAESVVIAEDITIRGDGDRDQIVILTGDEAGAMALDSWWVPGEEWTLPYALMVDDAAAVLENVTISTTEGIALAIAGGSPRVERVTIVAEDADPMNEPVHGLYLSDGTSASVSYIEHVGWLTITGGSSPRIEESDLARSCVQIYEASSATIAGSQLSKCEVAGWALDIAGSAPLLEGNTIGEGGIDVYDGGAPTVRGNVFLETGERGIDIGPDATGTMENNQFIDIEGHGIGLYGADAIVRGNVFEGNGVAVDARAPGGTVESNEVRGGTDGLVVNGGALVLRDNVVEGNTGRGIVVGSDLSATLSGNRSCGNGDNLWIIGDQEYPLDPSNEICEDDAESS